MITFKQLTIRNFLSFGNKPFKFDFKKGITRIAGENGSGKSTIVDALWFALFGKPYRKIRLDQLLNSINKRELEVTLTFSIGEDVYRIDRGIKPNYFKIFKNEDLLPLDSNKKTYQQLLEEEILHLNENTANQILTKSLTKNISFLTLSKGEKRQIIEGIFDIEIFSLMNRLCKNRVDELDSEISNVRKDITNVDQLIEREKSNLTQLYELKKRLTEEARKRAEETDEKVRKLQAENEKYSAGLEKIETYRDRRKQVVSIKQTHQEDARKLQSEHSTIASKLKVAEAKVKLFADTCPGCPKLSDISASGGCDTMREEMSAIDTKIAAIEDKIRECNEQIEKFDKILANEAFLKNSIKKNKEIIADIVKRAEQQDADTIVIDRTAFDEYKTRRQDLEDQYNTLTTKKNHFSVIKMLLADDGIKTFIIKRHLPSINKLLNTYLQKFHTDILFYFDSEFNEVIGTRYKEDFCYHSFSEGQKRRIDLAIMMAFAEFSKLKNRKANTNLMILDEITAGCDAIAENALYDILREIVNKEGKEVLTVSHSMAIDADKVDRVYHVKLDKGFSEMTRIES